MKERELFLAALEIEDPAARQSHLQAECADDAALLARVQSLLASHEGQSQFLNTPVAEQIADVSAAGAAGAAATMLLGNGSTQDGEPDATAFKSHGPAPMMKHQDDSDDEIPLGYLQPSSKPGSLGRLAHYEVLEVVGRGAFGTVLRAFDEKLQRVVAIKVMSPELASTSPARKRFLREAQASAAIRHEHVVSVYAVEEKPLPYLVMEYIPGQTLQQRLDERGPLDIPTVLRLGTQIAEGLAAAHAEDLIHRDIKPGNILLETGLRDRVKITDFGLARAADDASLTQSGMIAGTPMYMAPEQALGKKLDQRADLFSLGSVLYQMASGRPPFRASSTLAVLQRLTEDTPRPIREIIPETPQWLCDIITKLHAKNPDERYQTAREIAEVLANCETQLKSQAGLKDFSRIPRTKTQPAGWWKWVAVVALVFPLLAFGLYALTRPGWKPQVAENGMLEQPTPIQVTKQGVPESGGWVQLFNGKDLTGWKFPPNHPGNWEVKDGILRGSTRQSHLFSQRGDYGNFHLRAEVKVNLGGDSGILFRAPFELRRGRTPKEFVIPGCYEVELQENRTHSRPTGSISEVPGDAPPNSLGQVIDHSLTQPDEWFTIEISAANNHFITKVNGQETANCDDPLNKHATGHLALQVWNPNTVVQFRKIEIKELPPSPPFDATLPFAVAPFDAAQARVHQEAWAKHLGVPVEYTNSIGMKFRLIPPGEFLMGSSGEEVNTLSRALEQAGANDFDKFVARFSGPQHKVRITQPFYCGTYEVTVGEYRRFVEETKYLSTMQQLGVKRFEWTSSIAEPNADQRAVIGVSWDDAQEFCKWRSSQDGVSYGLPSEAQWEYACRAGTTTLWSFGDDASQLAEHAVFGQNSFWPAAVVGSRKPNSFGLFDLHGNADEWCRDWHDKDFYATSSIDDPVCVDNPSDRNSGRVARGGTALSAAWWTRSATRPWDFQATPSNPKGFRVALPAEAVKAAIAASNTGAAATATAPAKRRFASDEWIEVIPLIDPQTDKWDVPQRTGKNVWRIEQGELVVGGDPLASKLVLPLDSDWPAFECELEFTRRAGNSGLNVNLPTKLGECPLLFDPPGNGGVHLGSRSKGVLLKAGAQIETGQRATMRVEVRRQQDADHMVVASNGATLGEWTGDRNAIAYSYQEGFPHDRRVSLWIHAGGNEFVFHRIRVRMLDGGTAESLRPVPITPTVPVAK